MNTANESLIEGKDIVQGTINYIGDMSERAKFHAQDHRRDNLNFNSQVMSIRNARTLSTPPSLEKEGFMLVPHHSNIKNFLDRDELGQVYLEEISQLIIEVTGASRAVSLGKGGMLRYTEKSSHYGMGENTRPARFPHVDFTPHTAPGLTENFFSPGIEDLKPGQKLMGFNVWRAISGAPVDVPLAVCDSRTVQQQDLLFADGVYDFDANPENWPELESYVVQHNKQHQWYFFRDMNPDEVLIFRSYDNSPDKTAGVAHSAFNDPVCPEGAPPRASVESRVYAVFD